MKKMIFGVILTAILIFALSATVLASNYFYEASSSEQCHTQILQSAFDKINPIIPLSALDCDDELFAILDQSLSPVYDILHSMLHEIVGSSTGYDSVVIFNNIYHHLFERIVIDIRYCLEIGLATTGLSYSICHDNLHIISSNTARNIYNRTSRRNENINDIFQSHFPHVASVFSAFRYFERTLHGGGLAYHVQVGSNAFRSEILDLRAISSITFLSESILSNGTENPSAVVFYRRVRIRPNLSTVTETASINTNWP